ncbi:MAG: outer membrane lipoprotein-sorting protein, partial [bacterium]|nr:outer membrane lipoprotein-sorting protein [bacterium]
YDKRNQLKKIKGLEPVNVGKYWMAKSMTMENLKTKHKTEIFMENIEVDTGLEEKLFETRYMKRIHR